jgi:hypothetical protein
MPTDYAAQMRTAAAGVSGLADLALLPMEAGAPIPLSADRSGRHRSGRRPAPGPGLAW